MSARLHSPSSSLMRSSLTRPNLPPQESFEHQVEIGG
jgi:hypothetical protein